MPMPPLHKGFINSLFKRKDLLERARLEESYEERRRFWEEYWKSDSWRRLRDISKNDSINELHNGVDWSEVEKDLL